MSYAASEDVSNPVPTLPSDWTTAYAKLLSDPQLRALLRRDADGCAAKLGLGTRDKALLIGLDQVELEHQAQALLDKRFSAVRHLLPLTIERLGAQAKPQFVKHAVAYWPEGHLRHKLDAMEFCNRLLKDCDHPVCRSEHNRLSFETDARRLRVHFVRDFPVQRRRAHAIQILYRVCGRVRECGLHVGI